MKATISTMNKTYLTSNPFLIAKAPFAEESPFLALRFFRLHFSLTFLENKLGTFELFFGF